MPYQPPSGWIEPLPVNEDDVYVSRERFHTRPDCPMIRSGADLRQVDRPYSAAWCPRCAREFDEGD